MTLLFYRGLFTKYAGDLFFSENARRVRPLMRYGSCV